jgi:hypothetical protein
VIRAINAVWCVSFLAVSVDAATYAVKAGGGGNYTTIQACANAMSSGDTCVVYAGTYTEASSEKSVGHRYAPMAAGSSACATREPNAG